LNTVMYVAARYAIWWRREKWWTRVYHNLKRQNALNLQFTPLNIISVRNLLLLTTFSAIHTNSIIYGGAVL